MKYLRFCLQTLLLLQFIFFYFSGCSAGENGFPHSSVDVVNGVKDDISFPFVVQVEIGSTDCSASFIRKHVLLTAAHCIAKRLKSIETTGEALFIRVVRNGLGGRETLGSLTIERLNAYSYEHSPYLVLNEKPPSSPLGPRSVVIEPTIMMSEYYWNRAVPAEESSGGLDRVQSSQDIALIYFENSTYDGPTGRLSYFPVQPGASVYLAGFGRISHELGGYERRIGYNKVEDLIFEENLIRIFGPRKDEKVDEDRYSDLPAISTSNYGDSGGPLLDATGSIVGVASTLKLSGEKAISTYVNVSNYGDMRAQIESLLVEYDAGQLQKEQDKLD
jgi:hypothetical protein